MNSSEWLNAWAEPWASFMSRSTIDSALVFCLVGLVWLALRKRLSAQVGYLLFLLVLVKLILPGVISLPGLIYSWLPAPEAVTATELAGEPIRVIEIAPGMVKTDEFSLVRFGGDQARADAVYDNVPNPLYAEDVAEAIVHSIELPFHVDLDLVTIKPVAQAAPHKVMRGELNPR